MRENGQWQLGQNDKAFFVANRPIIDWLSLVGRPGAKGTLQAVLQSAVENRPLILDIPFQLAPCPLGFFMTEDKLVKRGNTSAVSHG